MGEAGPTLAQQLARFAAGTSYSSVPEEVRGSVRLRLLDVLGVSLAALPLDSSRAVTEHVAENSGAPHATALGLGARVPAAGAALVNGALAHSLDFDDTHLPSVVHPSATVIPAALAAAEQQHAHGRDLITAIAVGIEVCVRLGMAGYDPRSGNSMFFEHGQHATSICGAMGAATSAALLRGLDAEGVGNALGVAASMASGIIEANRTGGTVKRLHCGWAAQAGVSAAALAARGFTGPPTVLEGRFGLFQAFLRGDYHRDALLNSLGERWSTLDIMFKPYPANHFTHAGIDAAFAMRARGVRAQDVAQLRLGVPGPTVRTIGQPITVKRAPQDGYQAQFSGPYTVVAGLLGGGGLGLGLDDFTDQLATDPLRRDLMAKVSVQADPLCDELYPWQFPAVLTVRTVDGRELTEVVRHNRGGPKRPMSPAELEAKFVDNAGRVLPRGVVERVGHSAMKADDLPDAAALFSPVAEMLDKTVGSR
ncbi:MAG: MmgE/PrpD family protein [Micromonosporaceae bacterium]